MKKILFQGDSITDAGRDETRGSLSSIGQGYAVMVAGELGAEEPGKYSFENRGISGNRIVDLYARIKSDIWNIQPDIISLLIGVNDVLHEANDKNGVDAIRFEKIYSMLIEDTYKELPDVKFILMEPFVFCGTLTKDNWEYIEKEVAERGKIVRTIAKKYNADFVPLQEKFNEACKLCPPEYWVGDGVHPTVAGHGIIKREWMKVFKER